jgi:hypothetical protein
MDKFRHYPASADDFGSHRGQLGVYDASRDFPGLPTNATGVYVMKAYDY